MNYIQDFIQNKDFCPFCKNPLNIAFEDSEFAVQPVQINAKSNITINLSYPKRFITFFLNQTYNSNVQDTKLLSSIFLQLTLRCNCNQKFTNYNNIFYNYPNYEFKHFSYYFKYKDLHFEIYPSQISIGNSITNYNKSIPTSINPYSNNFIQQLNTLLIL